AIDVSALPSLPAAPRPRWACESRGRRHVAASGRSPDPDSLAFAPEDANDEGGEVVVALLLADGADDTLGRPPSWRTVSWAPPRTMRRPGLNWERTTLLLRFVRTRRPNSPKAVQSEHTK